MANSITILIRAKDQASSEIDKVKAKLNAASSSAGFKSIVQGAGMGIGMSAWGMLQGAIAGAADTVGDMVRAGMEAQAADAKLTAALKANVKGWDGNTDAIKRGIDARMAMGFSDDDLKASLTRLLPITKDVGMAQNAQAVAMDLARYKGISLTEATDAITKAMQGSSKQLKTLGIDTTGAADATTLLAEVQKVVAGQSAAYMGSLMGRLDAYKARIDNIKQDVGGMLGQMGDQVAMSVDFINFMLRKGELGFDSWAGSGAEAYAEYNRRIMAQSVITTALISKDWATAAAASGESVAELRASAGWLASTVTTTTTPAVKKVARASREAAVDFDKLRQAYSDLEARMAAESELEQLPLRIAVAEDDVVAAQKALNKARTKEDKHAAQLRLAQAKAELAMLREQLSSKTQIAAIERASKGAGSAMARGIAEGFQSATGRLSISVKSTVHAGAKALGGPVQAGNVYRVGETRPEYFIPDQPGYISPNAPVAGSGGSPVTLNLTVDGHTLAKVVDERLYYAVRAAAPSVSAF